MKKCLLLVQNDTHAKNFSCMIEDGRLADIGKIDCMLLDNLTKTPTKQYMDAVAENDVINFIDIPSFSRMSFYELPFWKRQMVVFNFTRYIKKNNILDSYDVVYLGNDGALQKAVLNIIRKKNPNCQLVLMIDGFLIINDSFSFFVKKWISKFSDYFNISQYFPSIIGTYSHLAKIIVMDTSVKSCLLHHGIPEYKICVEQLPRHRRLVHLREQVKSKKLREGELRVLYVATAYKWHQLHQEHRAQIKQIEKLKELAEGEKTILFSIRLHPRDKIDFYPDGFFDGIDISSKSLEEDLMSYDIIITSRSSIVYDASFVEINCLIYNEYFEFLPIPEYLNSIKTFHDFSQLKKYISNCKNVN